MFAINDINNGALKSIKAMPQKDITSDGTNNFSMDRHNYVETLNTITNTTNKQFLHKKWLSNRDASQVTTNRRVNEVGFGSLNKNQNLTSFTTYKDINTTRDALTRVRAGGAVAPKKKGANKNNAPVPGYPAGKLIRTTNHSLAIVHPKVAMAKKNINTGVPTHFH
jgi:hypothetical protein